jgi:hypothetical protein
MASPLQQLGPSAGDRAGGSFAALLLAKSRSALDSSVPDPRLRESYAGWIERFLDVIGPLEEGDVSVLEVDAFLSHLILVHNLDYPAIRRARCALTFLRTVVLAGLDEGSGEDSMS